jgi:hypothetical protein
MTSPRGIQHLNGPFARFETRAWIKLAGEIPELDGMLTEQVEKNL